MKIQLILLSIFFEIAAGSLTELVECVGPISQLKLYIDSMSKNQAAIRTLSQNAHECLGYVFERQRSLLRTFSTSREDDELVSDRSSEISRPPLMSDDYITDFILRNDAEEFKALLSAINDLKILEYIASVIGEKIIPRIETKLVNMHERLTGLRFQAIEVLNAAESQAVGLLQQLQSVQSNLGSAIFEKQKRRDELDELIDRNNRIFDQIEAPVLLPPVGRKISTADQARNSEWRAAIKDAIAAPHAVVASRIRAILRETPTDKHNQVLTYVRNKLIKTHELERSALIEKIAQDGSELDQLKAEETACLKLYSGIILDQTWFAQIQS